MGLTAHDAHRRFVGKATLRRRIRSQRRAPASHLTSRRPTHPTRNPGRAPSVSAAPISRRLALHHGPLLNISSAAANDRPRRPQAAGRSTPRRGPAQCHERRRLASLNSTHYCVRPRNETGLVAKDAEGPAGRRRRLLLPNDDGTPPVCDTLVVDRCVPRDAGAHAHVRPYARELCPHAANAPPNDPPRPISAELCRGSWLLGPTHPPFRRPRASSTTT